MRSCHPYRDFHQLKHSGTSTYPKMFFRKAFFLENIRNLLSNLLVLIENKIGIKFN